MNKEVPIVKKTLKEIFSVKEAVSSLRTAVYTYLDTARHPTVSGLLAALGSFKDNGSVLSLSASSDAIQLNLNLTRSAVPVHFTVPKFDLGLPALGLSADNVDVEVSVPLEFHLGFGFGKVDGTYGFYLDTSAPKELAFGVNVSVNSLDVTGRLGFLQAKITRNGPIQFGGSLAVDIQDPDNRLTLPDVTAGAFGISAEMAGNADINLKLQVGYNSPDPATQMKFPSVRSDFHIGPWVFDTAKFDTPTFDKAPQIEFNKIQLDVGEFFTNFAKPIVQKV